MNDTMMSTQSQKRRNRSGVRLPLWALGLLVLFGLALLTGATVWVFRMVRETAASIGEVSSPDFGSVVEPVQGTAVVVTGDPILDSNLTPVVPTNSNNLQPWSGSERVTLLLMGIDQRCDESEADLAHTDSMMIVTIDPVTKSGALLSLPRDLWVDIPGFTVDRINQAYFYGEAYEYPGGGAALAVETVGATLGIPINYYVTVNFDAFIQFVDLLGGIDVNAKEVIDDPSYPDRCYGYDPFHLEAGAHTLDGATALKFARSRATFGGDVDRAARQQQVVLAVRDKVLQLNMLPQLLRQAPQLWQSFQDNVRTNLSLDNVLELSLLMQDIPRSSIRTAVIDYNYVYNETTPDGRQVLVPIRDQIRLLRNEIFSPPPVPTPVIEDLPELMASEKARVAIYNGTAVFGLAGDTQAYLEKYNVTITEIGNADSSTYAATQIIDYGSHPNTVFFLARQMHIPPLNATTGTEPDGPYDILVILGNDWQVPTSAPSP